MRIRRTILTLTMVFLVSGPVLFADAAIYKWKDENGKTHFTDNPTKVPEAFRKKPFIKNPKSRKETPKARGKETQDKEASEKQATTEKPAETEIKEGDKQEGLTEGQRSAATAAVNFLKEDILRYEKFYSWPTSRSKFRAVKGAVAGATSQKQALLDQVSPHDLPLFKEVATFLETSIAADEKSQKVVPTTITSRRQTQTLMNRLKSETGQENQLLEKLTAATTD
ncbi:MAG: DUF4124 domain-containing protein [Nitrospina sp.]|nr:DUF4124 domain-containing protein [Nitrospina sp.]